MSIIRTEDGVNLSTSPEGNDVANAVYVNNTVLNPEYAHRLDEVNLNAVVAVGEGTAIDTLSYDKITVCIVASNVTTGGIFTFQGSPDNVNWGTVNSYTDETAEATQTIDGSGVFIFEMEISKIKYFRTNLTTRTDGTYTVYVWG